MSIKPNSLPVWRGGVLEVRGRDAAAFLHAQLMSDVRTLAPGDWHWSGWLSAKGRVVALGALRRVDEENFQWLLPDHPAEALAAKLQRFVFRSKVSLQARDEIVLTGVTRAVPDALEMAGRWLLVGAPLDDTIDPDAWAVEDLSHGLPRLPDAAVEAHTPQMLGLDFLRAYSVKKGCYPGQEIVARTHFLGQAKRRLQRLVGDAPFAPGEALLHDGARAGEVLCAASSGPRHEAQAVLPIDPPAARFARENGLGEARVMPFEPGLAR